MATAKNSRCAAPPARKIMLPVETAIAAITALSHPGEPCTCHSSMTTSGRCAAMKRAMKRAVRTRRISTAFIVGTLYVGSQAAQQAIETQHQPGTGMIEATDKPGLAGNGDNAGAGRRKRLSTGRGDDAERVGARRDHGYALAVAGQNLWRGDAGEAAEQQGKTRAEYLQPFRGGHCCTRLNVSSDAQGCICEVF
ncbi:MAG TPA: hypothetical protein VGQ35_11110 [Dongiaceae bacterium]|nr:hypothetical protein [Dongiaceae bacterium]